MVKHAAILTQGGDCSDPSENFIDFAYDLLEDSTEFNVTREDFRPCEYISQIQVALNFTDIVGSDTTFADLVKVPPFLETKLQDIFGADVEFSGEWLLEQFGSPSVNRLLEFIGSFFTDNARSPENFPDTCDGFQEVLDGNCIYTNCVGVTSGDKCFSCGTECNNGRGSDVIEGITDFPEWSFSRPRCIHDYCYSTTFTQSQCDSAFYEDMLEECPGKKSLTAKEQLECTLSNITDVDCCPAWAATYYAAVVGFGSDSYDEAQENMATHCPVETENSATTRWWQNPKESFFEYELQ